MARKQLTQDALDAVNAMLKRRSDEGDKMGVLTARVLKRLRGSVWHTTNSERFQAIVCSGAILPEPDIKDSERWSTGLGSEHYPYVRTLGGVSLFDFRLNFDPEQYRMKYPICSWNEFVPYRSVWGEAVWIEIDVSQLGNTLVSGPALLARWKAEQLGNRIMPEIEAAHLGPLPISVFKSAFRIQGDVGKLETLSIG
jgi:hypothetical protein